MDVATEPPMRLRGDRRSDFAARGMATRTAIFAAAGLGSGVLQAIQTQHLSSGITQTVIFAAVYAVAATIVTGCQLRSLRDLTRAQRRQVVHAVRHGTAPDDHRLAQSTLVHASAVKTSLTRGVTTSPMVALIVAAAALLAIWVATGQPLVLAAEGGAIGAWSALSRPGRRQREQHLSSAHFAELRAREVLGLPRPAVEPECRRFQVTSTKHGVGLLILAMLIAVVLGFQVRSSISHDHTSALDTPPARAGYAEVGTAAGTTVWLRTVGSDTLKVRVTGAIDEACTYRIQRSAQGLPAYQDFDLCQQGQRRNGSAVMFLAGTATQRASLELSDGTRLPRQTTIIRISHAVHGSELIIFVIPNRTVTGEADFN